jgi:molybdopterin-guanine dinucleotide biosynthesis protein A
MNCYLLVGGLSSRMGVPKFDVVLDGTTFGARVVEAARAAFDDVIAVERFGGGERAGLRTIFEDEHEGRGSIFGLQRALRDAGESRFWLLAIDYPLIDARILRDLRGRFEREPAASMLIPLWDGQRQMLCAGYSPSMAPQVGRSIRRGELTLRALIDERAVLVPEAELRADHPGEPLLNVNDPADLERARRLHERIEPSRL